MSTGSIAISLSPTLMISSCKSIFTSLLRRLYLNCVVTAHNFTVFKFLRLFRRHVYQ